METGGNLLRFGQFAIDVAAGEVRRQGVKRRLQPQPFKLLVLLVRRSGALVTHEEIRSELWPDGTFVEFDQSVHFTIRQIREALGDSADHPLYVETVPRRGYRFIAPVEAVPDGPGPASSPGTASTVRLQKALWTNIAELRLADRRRQRLLTWAVALLTLIAVLLAIAVYILMTP